ncbi:hypothetical protein Tco_0335803 [Tanacetum coccineum]
MTKKKTPDQPLKLKGIEMLSDAAILAADMKKAIKASKHDFRSKHQTGGSSEGVGSKPKVPDEPKGEFEDTSKGVGSKPEVLDVLTDQESEYESWDESEEDDDDRKRDDERTESDDNKSIDLNKTDDEEEAQEDEYELYDDVNVEMKDVKPADKVKGDEEITDAEKVDAEHEEINQEVVSAKVQDEVQITTIAAPATQKEKTKAPPSSSSRFVSSNYGSIFLNLDNIYSAESEIMSMLDVQVQQEVLKILSSSLLTVPVSVIPEPTVLSSIPEIIIEAPAITISLFIPHTQQSTPTPTPTTTEATTLTPAVDHSTTLLATMKSKVLTAIKEYLGTNLGDTLHKVLQSHTIEFIKEHSIPTDVKEQESQYTLKSSDKDTLKEFDQKRVLFETMTSSKSFNKHLKHKALYHALMESILMDENAIDQGVADKQKKRKPFNGDRDKDPPARLDQGLKKRNTSKDAEPSKMSKLTVYEAEATEMPQNQGNDMGTNNEQPNVEVALKKDWFKKPERQSDDDEPT